MGIFRTSLRGREREREEGLLRFAIRRYYSEGIYKVDESPHRKRGISREVYAKLF